MKKIAVLSALVLLSAGVAAGFAMTSNSIDARTAQPTVDDPPPEPIECPLCGGNPTLHARRMQVIEALQAKFIAQALRW